ncbi:hypothetical protein SAMN03080610_02293 [Afifella marina DSM 2698]|uniref:Uncharacterized protein n=1 Tax=Afifella marina DSM 2698 TaxID=1120955 RepID=A0A1G5NNQ1_AFIMA|nr:hypothetical protein SAMN03080610_02293 [Afifella marina DSM 2698]
MPATQPVNGARGQPARAPNNGGSWLFPQARTAPAQSPAAAAKAAPPAREQTSPSWLYRKPAAPQTNGTATSAPQAAPAEAPSSWLFFKPAAQSNGKANGHANGKAALKDTAVSTHQGWFYRKPAPQESEEPEQSTSAEVMSWVYRLASEAKEKGKAEASSFGSPFETISSWFTGGSKAKEDAKPEPEKPQAPVSWLYRNSAPQQQASSQKAEPARQTGAPQASWLYRNGAPQNGAARTNDKAEAAKPAPQVVQRSWLFPNGRGQAVEAEQQAQPQAANATPQRSWLFRNAAAENGAQKQNGAQQPAKQQAQPAVTGGSWLFPGTHQRAPAQTNGKAAQQQPAKAAETSGAGQTSWLFRTAAQPSRERAPARTAQNGGSWLFPGTHPRAQAETAQRPAQQQANGRQAAPARATNGVATAGYLYRSNAGAPIRATRQAQPQQAASRATVMARTNGAAQTRVNGSSWLFPSVRPAEKKPAAHTAQATAQNGARVYRTVPSVPRQAGRPIQVRPQRPMQTPAQAPIAARTPARSEESFYYAMVKWFRARLPERQWADGGTWLFPQGSPII